MSSISENAIKKVALRFLKTYYRFRPRSSETRAQIDMRTQSGIIADGLFSFQKENGQPFLATFEATSLESRKEVFYQLQNTLLWWDSVAVSSIITAFLFSFSQRYEAFTPHQFGLFSLLFCILASLLIFIYLYRWLFSWLRKYRYIYAIEQFKHYHADEQWIAIGDDVFKLPSEIDYLDELKNQCVINGFGLVSIDKELHPHLLITPAREELFEGQRKMTTFFEKNSQRIGLTNERITNWWNTITQLPFFRSSQVSDPSSLLRYQRSYFHQVILCLIAFSVLGGVFYNKWQDKPFNYVDENTYPELMDSISRTLQPDMNLESSSDELETLDYNELEPVEDVLAYNTEMINEEELLEPSTEIIEPKGTSNGEIYINSSADHATSYDCERFYNFENTVYLVQENTYALLGDAQQRMDLFAKKGIPTGLIWLGCFSSTEDDYVIFYDLLYDSREEARDKAKLFRQILGKHNLNANNVQLRSISHIGN